MIFQPFISSRVSHGTAIVTTPSTTRYIAQIYIHIPCGTLNADYWLGLGVCLQHNVTEAQLVTRSQRHSPGVRQTAFDVNSVCHRSGWANDVRLAQKMSLLSHLSHVDAAWQPALNATTIKTAPFHSVNETLKLAMPGINKLTMKSC